MRFDKKIMEKREKMNHFTNYIQQSKQLTGGQYLAYYYIHELQYGPLEIEKRLGKKYSLVRAQFIIATVKNEIEPLEV
ncbi:MAG: hypothetical protein Q4P17_03925 [Methanobacterium sp.]|nr:hypothetical protein [Methanobacterium sp.]